MDDEELPEPRQWVEGPLWEPLIWDWMWDGTRIRPIETVETDLL